MFMYINSFKNNTIRFNTDDPPTYVESETHSVETLRGILDFDLSWASDMQYSLVMPGAGSCSSGSGTPSRRQTTDALQCDTKSIFDLR